MPAVAHAVLLQSAICSALCGCVPAFCSMLVRMLRLSKQSNAQDCITDDADRRPSMRQIVERLQAARVGAAADAASP